jgi:hypothetical protein
VPALRHTVLLIVYLERIPERQVSMEYADGGDELRWGGEAMREPQERALWVSKGLVSSSRRKTVGRSALFISSRPLLTCLSLLVLPLTAPKLSDEVEGEREEFTGCKRRCSDMRFSKCEKVSGAVEVNMFRTKE